MRSTPFIFALLLGALLVSACDDTSSKDPIDGNETLDLTATDTDLGDGTKKADVADLELGDQGPTDVRDTTITPLPTYVRSYPLAESFPAPTGKTWRRSIIHLHSTHSHDACDGKPRMDDGSYNLPCLADLRAALCKVHVDFAYMTDHHTHLADTPFLDLLLHDPATDELIVRDGTPVANRFPCDDGFVVTTTVGMETSLMPLAFPAHLDPDPVINAQLLGGDDAATADRFHASGALVWNAHTEEKTVEQLEAWQVDGLEIYNLHANIDPRRLDLPQDLLIEGLLPYIFGDTNSSPDLALLIFLYENPPSLDNWAAILENRPVVGSAGTDAHQNVLQTLMNDGERFDSYRRMLAWFSNYVLADDESLDAFHSALQAGRLFVGFDTLADPAGFDAALLDANGARHEMGATVTFEAGLTLAVTVPEVVSEDLAPEITTLLMRVEAGHWVVVETTTGSGTFDWGLATPGIYRVEVRMVPLHLDRFIDGYLPDGLANRQMPWIYTNAFRVMP